ncbi:hypothetical protein KID03_05595 [bacterium]|nr:hypothetical protein [bacterium]
MSIGAVNSTENKNHTLRNTLIGAGIGTLGGAAFGQFSSPILKDGKYTDEFIIRCTCENEENIDSRTKKGIVKFFKKILNLKEKESSSMDDFLTILKSTDKKVFEFLEVDTSFLRMASSADEAVKAKALKKIIPDITNFKNSVLDCHAYVDKLYDRSSKSFKTLAENSDLEDDMKIAKKVFGEMKSERIGKFGAIGLLAGGLGAWAYSQFTKSKAND